MLMTAFQAIYFDVRQDFVDCPKRKHSLWPWRSRWAPFSNEQHFNRAVSVAMDQLSARAEGFDWEHERIQEEETIVVAEIIDVLMEACFPDVDRNSVVYRIALHYVVLSMVKRLHDRMRQGTEAAELPLTEYPEQVKRWSIQAQTL